MTKRKQNKRVYIEHYQSGMSEQYEYRRKNPPNQCVCDITVHGKSERHTVDVSYDVPNNNKAETKRIVEVAPEWHDKECARICNITEAEYHQAHNDRVTAGITSVLVLSMALGLTMFGARRMRANAELAQMQ